MWLLGYAERAHHEVQAALTLAQQLVSPFDVAFARHYATVLHLACGDLQAARFQAEATLTLCHDYGFTFFAATAQLLHDWIAAMQWPATTDLASLQRGLDTMRRTGSDLWIPYGLALLAATQQTPEQAATGLQLVTEAATLLAHTDERYYEAELHRLRGTLLRQQPGPDFSQAEACYGHALTVARSQQAKSLELRAAISLGQLWQEQGKRAAARQMLGEVYGWFTEGFATTDLREAEALLAVLCA